MLLNSLVAPINHFPHCFQWLNPYFAFSTLLWSASKLSSACGLFQKCGIKKWAKCHLLWSNQASSSNFLSTNTSWIYWPQPLLFHWKIHKALKFTKTLIPRTGTTQVWTKGKGQRAVLFKPISFFFPLAQEEPWKHCSVCPQPKFLAYL